MKYRRNVTQQIMLQIKRMKAKIFDRSVRLQGSKQSVDQKTKIIDEISDRRLKDKLYKLFRL